MAGNNIDINLRMHDDGSIERSTKAMQRANAEKDKLEGREYGVARSAVGTGAAGRDFAKQSQGLGGFVRLYATFAANAFAAQAAFTALSNAMDTTNMVKGMDQLGAASGMALGSLAKQFAETTQGAISFREAAQAVTKATASGLGAQQTLQIAQVATKASQALGVDLTDAVSRLSRGITKLEPELLDELGIFTKIEPAVEAYARKLGKAATQLTDFERRQAFAVAVLEEGNKKFSEINIDVNPYTKLLASFKDLAQTGLEFANNVLTPIVKLLANSPLGLSAVIAGIGVSLVRQAIPAITSWREGLNQAAEDAKKNAQAIATGYGERFVARQEKFFNVPELQRQSQEYANLIEKTDREILQKRAALSQAYTGRGKILSKIASGDPSVTDPTTGLLTKQAESSLLDRTKLIQKQIDAGNTKNLAALEREKQLAQELLALNAERAALVGKQALAQQALTTAQQSVEMVSGVPVAKFSGEWQRQTIARRATERAQRIQAYSEISAAAREGGMGEGFTKVRESMDSMPGIFNKIKIAGVGAFITIGNAITTALSAFAPWITVITLALPVLGYFYEKLRGNTKEIEATNKAFETLKDATDAATRTLEYYGSRGTKLTVEGAAAASTALFTLADAFEDVTNKAVKELSATGLYRAVENLQNLFGFGTKAELAKASVENLSNSFKLLESNTRFFSQFKEQVTAILNIPATSSVQDILEAVGKATPEVQKQIAELQKRIATQFKGATEETRAFNDQLNETAKIADSIITSLLPSTGMGRWADLGLKNVEGLNRELAKGADNLDEIRKLVNSTDMAKKFSPETVKVFLANQENINRLSQDQNNLLKQEDAIRQQLAEAEAQYQERIARVQKSGGIGGIKLSDEARATIRKQFPQIDELRSRLEGIQLIKSEKIAPEIKKVYDQIQEVQDKSAERFAQSLVTAIGASFAKAALVLEKGRASLLTQDLPKALSDYEITVKESGIQQQQLTETINLIKSLEQASVEMAHLANVTERKTIEDLKRVPELNAAEREKLKERERALSVSEGVIAGRRTVFSGGMRGLSAITGGGQDTGKMAKALGLDISGMAEEEAKKFVTDVRRGVITSSTVQNVTAGGKARADMAELENQKKVAAEIRDARVDAAKAAEKVRDMEVDISKLNIVKQARDFNTAYSSAADKAIVLANTELQIFDATQKTRQVTIDNQIATAERLRDLEGITPKQREIYQIEVDLLKAQKTRASEITTAERELLKIKSEESIRLAEISDRYRIIGYELERQNILLQATRQLEDANINVQKSRFDTLASMGRFTEQEIQDKNTAFTIAQAELDQRRQIQDIQKKVLDTQIAYQKALESGNTLEIQRTENTWLAELEAANLSTEAVKRNTGAKIDNARMLGSMSVEQKKFTDFATKGFESLGDAIADFAKTGKLNFKGLVDSMISDFIRLVIRMNMEKLAGGAGGQMGPAGMIGGWLSKVFGGSGGSSGGFTGDTGGNLFSIDEIAAVTAKGAAYDSGIQKFAKGGMFTNSIVHSPTLFKFAKGTGLMGEAGPEAIMPLTRDNTGRLGVQAQGTQPQVDVVVNNYSGQQATTRQTKDSKGNRRIEVIVGDMTAGEMSRPGSTTQQSLRNNFGVQPTLTRR